MSIHSLLTLLLLCAVARADFLWWGHEHRLPNGLADSLLAVAGDSLQLRLSVCDAHSGQALFEHDARVPVTPASLTKLLTAVTALDLLGPEYRFRTLVGFNADSLHEGTLGDTLHLICGGNPDLVENDLLGMGRKLRGMGLDSLDAPFVIHTGRYDSLRMGPGWMWDDGTDAWSARISAATVNGNGLVLRPGRPVEFSGWPGAEAPGSAAMQRDWMRQRDVFRPLPRGTKSTSYLNVEHPDSLYARVLMDAFRSCGLVLGRGFPVLDSRPVSRQLQRSCSLAVESRSLGVLLDSVLTHSWNLGAECVFQELGVATDTTESEWMPGSSWKGAAELLVAHVRASVGNDLNLRLVDGSGLSRYNAVPLQVFSRLLVREEAVRPSRLRPLLARPGTGSLKARFQNLPPGIGLRAKTGSLWGSQLLAAYLYREPETGPLLDSDPLPEESLVVILGLEGNLAGASRLRAKQERIIGLLARWMAKE